MLTGCFFMPWLWTVSGLSVLLLRRYLFYAIAAMSVFPCVFGVITSRGSEPDPAP